MLTRLEFHQTLVDILGSKNVFYTPPESVKLSYPAVVYSLTTVFSAHANNEPYLATPQYEVILIDNNPDSGLFEKFLALPYTRYNRHYVADNLDHYVFTTYF